MSKAAPLSVAIISPTMGRYGGLEEFVLALGAGISQIPGFAVEVVFKRAAAFELHADLRSRILRSGVTVSFCDKASRALWHAIVKADLVHLQNPCPDVAVMARLARKPLLINVINHLGPISGLHVRLWRWCLRLAQRRFYISEFVRRTWEGNDTPRPGSQVVFPLCELAPLAPRPVSERRGFVFVARWIENKGLDVLVEAWARAGLGPESGPLQLLGDGPLRARIEARVKELQLKNIVMPGFVTEQEKAGTIARSRFAVIPPHTREDFGLVAVEARHLGVPCIITRDGGLPEAAGTEALVCEPGDVTGLTECLLKAATMDSREYADRSRRTRESLSQELKGPAFYSATYAAMVRGTR
jgi:glycosyltransferase involved in cell wall biosynthesis